MFIEYIRKYQRRVKESLEPLGARLSIELGSPASIEEVAFCETTLGKPLPADLKLFLTELNGVKTTVAGPLNIVKHSFGIAGTGELVRRAHQLEEFIEEVHDDHGEPPTKWQNIDVESLRRNITVIDGLGSSYAVMALNSPRNGSGTDSVCGISFEDCTWMLEGAYYVAASLEEYVSKSLDFMVESRGRGFWYLDDDAEESAFNG